MPCYEVVLKYIRATRSTTGFSCRGTLDKKHYPKKTPVPDGSRIIEREPYYRVVAPEISKVYSSDDALTLSAKNEHHGPWDESEQLAED